MASVILERRAEAPIGSAGPEAVALLTELFPGIPIADMRQLHLNRQATEVECILLYSYEATLAQAKAIVDSGEVVKALEFIP
jgi:hypothetical protein